MVQLLSVSAQFVQVFTCVLVPALADTRCRAGRGAVTPRKKQGSTFHREEALANTRREGKRQTDIIGSSNTRISAKSSNRLCPFV